MEEKLKEIEVKVPASIANLGPGFDVFAIAISGLHDIVTVKRTKNGKIELEVTGAKAESIPKKLEDNTAGLVAKILMREFSIKDGFRIHLRKGVSHSLGLGSSGASAAGTVYAIDQLYGLNLSETELVSFASQGEEAASGSAHADNVSASILGGFVIIQSYNPIKVYRLWPPKNLGICVVIPKVHVPEKKTAFARKILPHEVALERLIHNVGHASSFVYGMVNERIDIVKESMSDAVIERVRSRLIPGYDGVKEYAKEHDAHVSICGSGPSIVAFFDLEKEDPSAILNILREGFKNTGIPTSGFITYPSEGIGALTTDRDKIEKWKF